MTIEQKKKELKDLMKSAPRKSRNTGQYLSAQIELRGIEFAEEEIEKKIAELHGKHNFDSAKKWIEFLYWWRNK